jgi:hypothetical protein
MISKIFLSLKFNFIIPFVIGRAKSGVICHLFFAQWKLLLIDKEKKNPGKRKNDVYISSGFTGLGETLTLQYLLNNKLPLHLGYLRSQMRDRYVEKRWASKSVFDVCKIQLYYFSKTMMGSRCRGRIV